MSRAGALLDEAHRTENRVGGHLTRMVVQRRASRPLLEAVAMGFRRAADLVDEAAAELSVPTEGDPQQ